jgi:hypothetical protein
MKLPLVLDRRTATSRELSAGCFVCHGDQPRWFSANAQALAAQHHDRTGHATWCEVHLSICYGRDAADERQVDIEDAIAASSSGGEPEAAPLPVPDAPAASNAGVSASSAAHRDMRFNARDARGRKPETFHV